MPVGKHILLFGAGKSATELIAYLVRACHAHDWTLDIADVREDLVLSKTQGDPRTKAHGLDIQAEAGRRRALIAGADLVISLLPPNLHYVVALDCLDAGRHLLTASYVDERLKALGPAIREKDLLFLCEMGLDPGIDHMSALRAIQRVRNAGGAITAFYSHCGGLVAPESDDNPWHYKISWNSRNVVLAGKGGARFRQASVEKTIPYAELFDANRQVLIPGLGYLAWYPNRDSLPYASLYGLDQVPTFIRTTLRHPEFCGGWKQVVHLHLTDERPAYETKGMSLAGFFHRHSERFGFTEWLHGAGPLSARFQSLLKLSPAEAHLLEQQFLNLGWNSGDPLPEGNHSAADILQFALEKKWALQPRDRDMVVMLHEIHFLSKGCPEVHRSTLVVKGSDSVHTAMARTVGLPLGIAAVLILQELITLRGLHIPILPEVYDPVLQHLSLEGITFGESESA